MSNAFRITPRAKADLKNIWSYTLGVWGEAQADKYVREIYARFEWLAARPNIGKHRPDIGRDYYCFAQGRHLVFYLIREHGIDIIGVPHKEMDIVNYFDSDD